MLDNLFLLFFQNKKKNLIDLFIFGCAGSSLLHGVFSSCGGQGYSLVVMHRLLIAVGSLVVEHGL